jgi:hypothetical protein
MPARLARIDPDHVAVEPAVVRTSKPMSDAGAELATLEEDAFVPARQLLLTRAAGHVALANRQRARRPTPGSISPE